MLFAVLENHQATPYYLIGGATISKQMLKRLSNSDTYFDFSYFLYIFVKKSMEKVVNHEEHPDYLMEMFKNYFKFAKYNHYKIPFELLVDAIGGGLSGANFPDVNRTELLQSLISNCHLIQEAAQRTLELRQPAIVREAEKPTEEKRQKGFLNIDEVCEQFGLPKSNIKDKAWRDRNAFPYLQTASKGRVTFKTCDVENWIKQQKH